MLCNFCSIKAPSDIGNIAIGVMFVVMGVCGFIILKVSEKRKDKK